MSDLNSVLKEMFGKRPETDSKELVGLGQRLLSEDERLFTKLQRPENRELIHFAIAWSEMQQEMQALKQVIDERLREIRDKQADPLAELLDQLIVKDKVVR